MTFWPPSLLSTQPQKAKRTSQKPLILEATHAPLHQPGALRVYIDTNYQAPSDHKKLTSNQWLAQWFEQEDHH